MAGTQTIEASLVTARGYKLLEDELARLRSDGRSEISELLRLAREDGHPADNPALGELFDEQAQLEARIATLEGQLATAQIARPTQGGRVGVGSAVRVRHLDDDRVAEYEVVVPRGVLALQVLSVRSPRSPGARTPPARQPTA